MLPRSECLGSSGASGALLPAAMLSKSQTSTSCTRTAGLLHARRVLRALAHSKPAARRVLPVHRATVKEFGRLDLLERVYGGERTFAGQLYVRALPGPLQYLPSFLVPGTLALSSRWSRIWTRHSRGLGQLPPSSSGEAALAFLDLIATLCLTGSRRGTLGHCLQKNCASKQLEAASCQEF